MCKPKLKSVALAIPVRWRKFRNLKGQCDLDYVRFWPTFVLLIFHSLQPICVRNLNHVSLTVREIFTGVRKCKSRSPKLGRIPFDLVFCMPSKLLFVVDAYTKFEVFSFNRSRDIGVHILKILALSAILDSIFNGFWQLRSFHGTAEYHLVKFEHTCGWVRAM